MLFTNRWIGFVAGSALALALAGCGGTASGSGGSGGSAGGAGGSTGTAGAGGGTGGMSTGGTGTGGSGGAAQALADQGITQNECGPADGPAIGARIGTPSMCGDTPNGAPQAWFLAYPAQEATLATGDAWDYDIASGGNLSVTWYPQGSSGAFEAPTKGHLEVLEVNAGVVRFGYSFEVAGASYGGTATLTLCDNQPLCG